MLMRTGSSSSDTPRGKGTNEILGETWKRDPSLREHEERVLDA